MDVAGLVAESTAAWLVPWLWGGLGLLVGAGIAVVVIRHHTRP